MAQTIEHTRTEQNYVHNQYYGGYAMYWQLYSQLMAQLKTVFKLMGKNNKLKKISLLSLFALKTPYWLFIKPLGSMFNVTRKFNGSYEITNNVLTKTDVVKVVIYNIILFKNFKIPFMAYKSGPTVSDWRTYLIKDKPEIELDWRNHLARDRAYN